MNTYSYVGGNPLSHTDPTGEIAWFIPVVTGAIGAAAGGVGNYLVQKYVQHNCKIDWSGVWNAAGWGAVAGASLPYSTGLSGAMGIGGATGLGQYFTGQAINGDPPAVTGAVSSVVAGVAGGAAGGAFTRPVTYGTIGTALPAIAAQQGALQTLSANTGLMNLMRNLVGGVIGNEDPTALSNQGCACPQ